ncbi:ribose 5-phosphate isomerase A [Mucilaginibacter agri]|uniref:Ribose 5-phosphate isomerase A n=1 Tax=Mucilaginibacter agri TaxID=2695265 RepID=A0A966DSN5_9SPHI|nr:ribose 5-phosphate isomerase A [Mucilaginibacter agri]NCD68437.1 ribose 5-phosphate isomerase A [Mucilaginibacter agri]
MANYKQDAAKACLQFLKPLQVIGLGAGATIAYLVDFIAGDVELANSITFVSSSFQTRLNLEQKGLKVKMASQLYAIDIYFDGCDQFDAELNALKSGGGIHTSEKILASTAKEFILIGDESKFVPDLDHTYPVVIEILPEALNIVTVKIEDDFPLATVNLRSGKEKDGAVISDNGNLLANVKFDELPDIAELNTYFKMMPGIVDHSLFYQMATKAVVAGEHGVRVITPQRF